MTVDREALQNGVLALVQGHDVLSKLQCAVFPDSADEFRKKYLASAKGACLVSYAGARRLPGEQAGAEVLLDVVVLARKASGPLGGPALLTAAEDALDEARVVTGPAGWLLDVVNDAFDGEENGVHHYVLRVRCTLL